MNAVVIPDVESGDPTRYVSRVAKLIAVYDQPHFRTKQI
jgi:hypothetical protein